MNEEEMNSDKVCFNTDKQSVSLHPQGVDSAKVAPAARRMPRLVKATLAFMAVTIVSSLVALLVVDLYHFGRVAELQEAIQMFKGHVENSSTCGMEIQMLMCRVDNVSSQIQMLGGHLENTSADIQMVKGILKDASSLSFQTQMLKRSLEGANAEIQKLKGDMEKENTLNSQTRSFLKSSLENTTVDLYMLNRDLENANTEIQVLKAGLEMANAQAQLANGSLKNADAQIRVLRGSLESINDLRAQNQVLRSSLEGANAEIQQLKVSLQNANALNSQTQTFIKDSLDNTSAEIQLLRSHLERAGDEIHLLKRDLETLTVQTRAGNRFLEQTDAQIQVFKTKLEKASALNSQIQMLNGDLKNASREIQTLKQKMKDAVALNSKTRMLESNLQNASAEIQRLIGDLRSARTLTTQIQEVQSRLDTLHATFALQEQLQRSQDHLLQQILQGWKVYHGSLYYFSRIKKSWHAAERFCVSQGAHLASVTSEEEQEFLAETVSNSYHWIGLTDMGTEGSWRWVDGTQFSDTQSRAFWEKNQPDNWLNAKGHTEDCVHTQQRWNDMDCDVLYPWVCKKPIGQGAAEAGQSSEVTTTATSGTSLP
ncbi:PREDICTED: C-type lectin domain family 4 member F [Ceratotherium simum simum]|uniref:C-type lectin domain family 4 member F n=1 Tax=Ceratotherium simum simum TaxID=73337 RepID=A0ABM1D509_CERSS|nr:PREDICTED: C-type lectin domain family 4 member F [Ceratotherium simum simum]